MKKSFTSIYILYILCISCTYNVSMIHTEGEATDVIDNNQDANADISPEVSIPAAVL